MATKKPFFCFGSLSINDGSQLWFWEDRCLGNTTFHEQYPALFTTVRNKSDTIATMATSPPNVSFRRDLIGLLEMPYFNVWILYSFLLGMMNFDGIYMPMAIF
jgi:hypothetical protein